MTKSTFVFGTTLLLLGSSLALAQDKGKKAPPPPMSFFVTSTGSGKGADLGGLAGADALCQRLRGRPVRPARRVRPGMPISARKPRAASRR